MYYVKFENDLKKATFGILMETQDCFWIPIIDNVEVHFKLQQTYLFSFFNLKWKFKKSLGVVKYVTLQKNISPLQV